MADFSSVTVGIRNDFRLMISEFPNWNTDEVSFRLTYRIAGVDLPVNAKSTSQYLKGV